MIKWLFIFFQLGYISQQVAAQDLSEKVLRFIRSQQGFEKINTNPVNINIADESLDSVNLNQSQYLLFNNTSLYINNNGSSKVFVFDESNNKLKRIDNSKFEGYNYGAAVFFYKDTLFNIGGYGFWSTTGSLRYFDPIAKEWNIIKTNKNISFSRGVNALTFYDNIKHKLHVIYNDYSPEYIINKTPSKTLYYQCLDMKAKAWLENSKIINSSVAAELDDIKIIQETSNGLLVTSKKIGSNVFLDFENNKIHELKEQFITSYLQKLHDIEQYVTISKMNEFVIYDLKKDKILKFDVSKNLSKNLAVKIYQNDLLKFIKEYFYLFIQLSLIIILMILILYKSRKKEIHKLPSIDNQSEKNTLDFTNFIHSISEVEKKVLSLLISNSLSNKKASVEEINKVLGLEKRTYKIQNNMRAQIISSINKLFGAHINTKDILIERERSNFDKRYFDYNINQRYLQKMAVAIREMNKLHSAPRD